MRRTINNFYHIYPLGLCGAPERNPLSGTPENRLEPLYQWADHMKDLGIDALYLGPLFESTTHGYDTADWYHIDRRLCSDEEFKEFSAYLKEKKIRLILDGVFHHSGRDFWAFRDLREKGDASPYKDWFSGVDFSRTSPYNDPFYYDPWEGYYELVKLNLKNRDLVNHLLGAVESWVRDFDIGGLRLDVAYLLDKDFLKELSSFTRSLKPDFFLLGEVIHGDYRNWGNKELLDSVTNYECFKGLYSSQNDANLFEISYSLNRQFGQGGLYNHLPLYNFLDNHDVNRIGSLLKNRAHLYTSYILLYTIPGIPSIYYGSEWGIPGKRNDFSDQALRPSAGTIGKLPKEEDLFKVIKKLIILRNQEEVLRQGDLTILHTASKQLAFSRSSGDQQIICAINIDDRKEEITLDAQGEYKDLLNPGETFSSTRGKITLPIYPHWGRILKKM